MNIKSVNDYFPEMDIIDSDIKEKIEEAYERVRDTEVSEADVLASLNKTNLTERDFYNLISDQAENHLEEMGGACPRC